VRKRLLETYQRVGLEPASLSGGHVYIGRKRVLVGYITSSKYFNEIVSVTIKNLVCKLQRLNYFHTTLWSNNNNNNNNNNNTFTRKRIAPNSIWQQCEGNG
jgi:hypothetical protein